MKKEYVGTATSDMKKRGSFGPSKPHGTKIKPGIKANGVSKKIKQSYMGG